MPEGLCGEEGPRMPSMLYDLIRLVEARPLASAAALIAAALYIQLMTSGPRIR